MRSVFEGGFPTGDMSPAAPVGLLRRLTAETLSIRLHDLDHLTVICSLLFHTRITQYSIILQLIKRVVQNKRIASLSVFHGCRKRRLKD
jgi:hypothetical protein